REGLGWGGLPRWLIADDLASGRLVEIDLESFREVSSPLFAMHRNDRSPKPAAAWLIDQFKRQLGCFNEFEPGEVPEEETGHRSVP
ncbi:LysR family transcriptional regulator, partial [Mesorhizobium sp. M7A.F.Ca.CA.002.05.1.1]